MSDDLLPGSQTMLFAIPAEAVAHYRAWKAEADRIYLSQELERRGRTTIMRFQGENQAPSFDQITALTELGEAEPVYDTVGEGFPFEFRLHQGGCTLSVAAPVQPFEIAVPIPQLLNEALPTPSGNGILAELPR